MSHYCIVGFVGLFPAVVVEKKKEVFLDRKLNFQKSTVFSLVSNNLPHGF